MPLHFFVEEHIDFRNLNEDNFKNSSVMQREIWILGSITPATRRHDINILVPTLPQEISSHGENWAWISLVSVLTAPPPPHLI